MDPKISENDRIVSYLMFVCVLIDASSTLPVKTEFASCSHVSCVCQLLSLSFFGWFGLGVWIGHGLFHSCCRLNLMGQDLVVIIVCGGGGVGGLYYVV